MKKTLLMAVLSGMVAFAIVGCTPGDEGNTGGTTADQGGAKTMTPPPGGQKGKGGEMSPGPKDESAMNTPAEGKK